jgi:serine/threonine protein kinase
MMASFTCPRCFYAGPIGLDAKFCPHCGLFGAREAAADTSPLDVTVADHNYRVMDRIAIGSVCTIYRCRFTSGGREKEGIFKIARDARVNGLVANEADILRRLHAADPTARFTPFLPAIEASMAMAGEPNTGSRQASVLRMHDEIESPTELYTLFEARSSFPAGLDARHVAWIWRRLLSVLGFIHAQGIVHGAVLPMHVMIEPKDHKLLLIDWCCATRGGEGGNMPLPIIAAGHLAWYKSESASTQPPMPALDIALGARSMIELLGGDPISGQCPDRVDSGLQRHFQRCIKTGPNARPDAWKLLDDFDRLIEALWGPRKFITLTLAPKAK